MTARPTTFAVAEAPLRVQDLLLAVALALFSLACAWVHVEKTPLGVAPDEMAHLTYVHEVAVDGRWLPDYANSIRLPKRVQKNYMGHPPLYYTTLGLIGRAAAWDPVQDYRAYRALSAGMVALGILLWVLTGRALGLPATWLVVAVAACNAVPMFPYLAGSINNDNLAFLGVAIAVFGVARLPDWPRAAFHVGALGLLVVLLTKATAALFLCAFFVFWAAPRLRDRGGPFRSRHFLAALLGVAAIAGGYYAYTIGVHGTPFPKATRIYAGRMPPADPMRFLDFATSFAKVMARRLPAIMSFDSLRPITEGLRPVFFLMVALPAVAWLGSAMPRAGARAAIPRAFLLALLATLAVHVVFVWRGYLGHGLLAGIQPRYYNYALPGLFILGFVQARDRLPGRMVFAAFALVTAVLLGLGPALVARAQLEQAADGSRKPATASAQALLHPGDAGGMVPTRVATGTGRAGAVDGVRLTAGKATVTGWAIERADRSAARRLLVLVDGQLVGTATTGGRRPDVARAIDSDAAATSGFRIEVRQLPPATTACDLAIAVEQADGTVPVLRSRGCRP